MKIRAGESKAKNLCQRCSSYIYIRFDNGVEIAKCSMLDMNLRYPVLECNMFTNDHPINQHLSKYALESTMESMKIPIIGESHKRAGYLEYTDGEFKKPE